MAATLDSGHVSDDLLKIKLNEKKISPRKKGEKDEGEKDVTLNVAQLLLVGRNIQNHLEGLQI